MLNIDKEYDDNIFKLQSSLAKKGYLKNEDIDGYYCVKTEKAIEAFELDNNISSKEKLNPHTTKMLLQNETEYDYQVGKYNRQLYSTSDEMTEEAPNIQDSFFTDEKTHELRKKTVTIKIKYADTGTTVIDKVSFRSVGRRIDSSGEAVYEMYEFVARDIKEFVPKKQK